MVNYLYDHDSIENNHEAFVRDRTIVRSPEVDALMQASLPLPAGERSKPEPTGRRVAPPDDRLRAGFG
jgi:hypothetical protein